MTICAQQMLTPQPILLVHKQTTQLLKQLLLIVVWEINQQLLLLKQHIPMQSHHLTCEFWHSSPATLTGHLFQQHQTAMGGNQGNTGDDDNLSVALGPTHTNTIPPIPTATPATSVTSVT